MPRDLLAERDAAQDLPTLHKSPEQLPPSGDSSEQQSGRLSGYLSERRRNNMDHDNARSQVKPYVQTLTLADVDSCVRLEEATFPPQERCTREKFVYRFTKCGELSLGLFTSAETGPEAASKSASGVGETSAPDASLAVTAETSQPVYSGAPSRKAVLLAHIVATKTTGQTLADNDMALPENWRQGPNSSEHGHQEAGRTVALHSLAVLPAFQHHGLATTLMKSYMQRIEGSCIADRIALIAHHHLIDFYQKLGFENKGKSGVQFGGGDWYDMVLELKNQPQPELPS